MKRKIMVFTGNRADYGLIFPVIKAIKEHPSLEYNLVIAGNHLSNEYGRTEEEIKRDGLEIHYRISLPGGGTTPTVMADTVGICVSKVAACIQECRNDITLIIGDRMETFGAAIASIYSNVPVAHIFGGDKADCDMAETSVRHAITKLSHIHFVASDDSRQRVLNLGEEEWRVHNYGSPSMDNLVNNDYANLDELQAIIPFDLSKPVLVFTLHSVTMDWEKAGEEAHICMEALKELGMQTVITYPNNDAGGQLIIDEINKYSQVEHFYISKSLGRRNYLGLLKYAAAVVGNSSSGLLETPFFKIPCVNIGTRQQGRIRSTNVIDTPFNISRIKEAVNKAIHDVEFRNEVKNCINPFGEGNTGKKIAAHLAGVELGKDLLIKKITY